MRGKHPQLKGEWEAKRITPADAGKTINVKRHNVRCTDHPRGCGENLFMMVGKTREAGSPPRMRGKPRVLVRAVGQCGITPADAGKTC